MKAFESFKERLKRNPLIKQFLEQYGFKTMVLAVVSLILSAAFAVMNGVLTGLYRSVWYGALTFYYVTLILFRGAVIAADRKCWKKFGESGEERLRAQNIIYFWSGAFLLVIGAAMCGAVTLMVISKNPSETGEIAAIATAAYTFFKITMAAINIAKARKFASPVSQALRNLNFADACMSMVSLTVLLLATFGADDGASFIMAMKACVGFAACAVTLAMAVFMIVKAVKNIRKDKENGREER